MLTGPYLNKKLEEAQAAYRVCELVRQQLKSEYDGGQQMDDLVEKLLKFYEVAAPTMARTIVMRKDVQLVEHFLEVIGNKILIFLTNEEWVDWSKVRDFFAETWPDADINEAIKPNKVTYRDKDGNIVQSKTADVIYDTQAKILLEKTGIDHSQRSSLRFAEHFGTAIVEGSTVKRTPTNKHEEPVHPVDKTLGGMTDCMLKTEAGAPISLEQIRKAGEALEKMPEDIKHALYRYWRQLTQRDVRIELVWTHFGTFAMWAVENGYELGYRMKKADPEEGYVLGNVTWVPVEEMRK